MITIFKIFFLSLMTYSAFAGEIYVIASAGVTLAQAEVKEVFLGNKQLAGQVKLIPVDNKAIQTEFLAKIVGVDKIKYDSTWAKKSFQDGLMAPKTKGSDADVIDFIKNNLGGIGYVSTPGDNKVIAKF